MDIKNLLAQLIKSKGSDLLLAAYNPPCLRINNALVKIEQRNLTAEETEALVTPIIRKHELEEFKRVKELDTSFEDENSRYRINLHYQMGAIGATIRRVPKEIPNLEELKLPPIVKTFAGFERGLILVTGPTGCGKSTTQAAMINFINATREWQAFCRLCPRPEPRHRPARLGKIGDGGGHYKFNQRRPAPATSSR